MKKLLSFVSLIALLITASVVAAQTGGLPGTGWETGQQIQNASTIDTGTVALVAYSQTGTSFNCDTEVLAPGASFTWLPENCQTPTGFIGSGVASADVPIVAVVNVNNRTVSSAAGQYTGTDGSNVSTTISFPLVKNNHSSRTTTFYVQNASDQTNNLTATFTQSGTGSTFVHTYNNVPANSMVIITPSDAGFPSGTGTGLGGLTVVGTQPLAGSSLEHETSTSLGVNLQASRAFTPNDYDSTLYCPLIRREYGSQTTTTGIQVQNVSGGTETVQVTYNVISPSARTFTVTSTPIANGESYTFLQANDLNSGELASATVESLGGGEVVAIVNDRATNPSPNRFTTYACFGETGATTTISLPLVKENFNNNTTGVQVQNVGNANATFTLTYKTTTGITVSFTHTDAVAPGASKTFYRVSTGGTSSLTVTQGQLSQLNSTINGVVITSSQPIVAIANESNYTGAGNVQDTKNYEGFNR